MTEREFVIRELARYASERPGVARADLVVYLRDRVGRSHSGASGWLPHVPRREAEFWGEDGRVKPEWLKPEHTVHYSCHPRGVYIGPMSHVREGKPDISYEEIADFALSGTLPVQMSLFGDAA